MAIFVVVVLTISWRCPIDWVDIISTWARWPYSLSWPSKCEIPSGPFFVFEFSHTWFFLRSIWCWVMQNFIWSIVELNSWSIKGKIDRRYSWRWSFCGINFLEWLFDIESNNTRNRRRICYYNLLAVWTEFYVTH